METLQSLELSFILFLQNLGDWLLYPMQAITFLGNLEFYLLMAPVLYWCIDTAVGVRFGMYFMLTGGINVLLKLLFQTPRPYWVDPRVVAYTIDTAFGLPSGHAQNSLVVFGSMTRAGKIKLRWIAVIALAFLIGFSRLYLGVHFIRDVLSGWIIGGVILWLAFRWESRFVTWFSRQSEPRKYLFVTLVSIAALILGGFLLGTIQNQVLPEQWSKNLAAAVAPDEVTDPYSLSILVSISGAFWGLAAGAVWLHHKGGFDTKAQPWKLALRYLSGLVGVIFFYYALDMLFPEGETVLAFVFRYIRYALVGIWISALAPMVFKRLRI